MRRRRWRYRARRGLPALLGARAAIEARDFAARRDDARAPGRPGATASPSATDARSRDEARAGAAAAKRSPSCSTLRKEAGSHTAALRLELRALQGAGRYAEIPPIVDQLVKRKAYGATRRRVRARGRPCAGARRARPRCGGVSRVLVQADRCGAAACRRSRARRRETLIALGGDREAADDPGAEPGARVGSRARCGCMRSAGRPTCRRSSSRPSAGSPRTATMQRSSMRWACFASARNSGGRRSPISRRASRTKTGHARRAGRALRAARPRRRGEHTTRRRAQARARRARSGVRVGRHITVASEPPRCRDSATAEKRSRRSSCSPTPKARRRCC